MVGRYLPPLLSVVGGGVEAMPVKVPRTRSNRRCSCKGGSFPLDITQVADLGQATEINAIPQQTLHSILHTLER